MPVRIQSNATTKAGLVLLALGLVVYLLADHFPAEPAWLQHLDLALLLLATVVYLVGRIQMLVAGR